MPMSSLSDDPGSTRPAVDIPVTQISYRYLYGNLDLYLRLQTTADNISDQLLRVDRSIGFMDDLNIRVEDLTRRSFKLEESTGSDWSTRPLDRGANSDGGPPAKSSLQSAFQSFHRALYIPIFGEVAGAGASASPEEKMVRIASLPTDEQYVAFGQLYEALSRHRTALTKLQHRLWIGSPTGMARAVEEERQLLESLPEGLAS